MTKTFTRLFIAVTFAVGFAAPSRATTWLFQALLNGMQEVPANNSQGQGVASMSFDDVTNKFNVAVFVQGLQLANLTDMHIHRAPVGVAGPVIVPIGVSGFTQTQSGLSFMATNLDWVPGTGNINTTALIANGTYLNLHTVQIPSGEIRGQLINVTAVPEPSTVVLLAAGLGIAALRARRKK